MSNNNGSSIKLSKEQKEILELSEGNFLVLAPPGSGKTELLAQRVRYAIEKGISQKNMLCLTFTKKAAYEMMERVCSQEKNDLFIGNIHQYCSQFLFREKVVNPSCSILDEEDAKQIIKEHILKDKSRMVTILKKISEHILGTFIKFSVYLNQKKNGFPNKLLLPLEEANELSEKERQVILKGCRLYEWIKQKYFYLDYDDLLTYSYLVLKKRPLIKPYTWIQVDEVQDLNPLQWEIIKLLSANKCHHVLFGDYGQAIFSFMGARTESLKDVEKTYRVYKLRQNYRSPADLVDVYNSFSEKYMENDGFKILPYRSESKDQNLIFFTVVGSREDEAERVVKVILPSVSENKDETAAILVRSNKTADVYSKVLTENGKEHFKVSGFDLFSRSLVKDSLAFLNVLANRNDRKAWSRVFKIFSKTSTLKKSRKLIWQIYELGMLPADFLESSDHTEFPFVSFNDVFENGRVVVFDTETTGLDSSNDIIQIGAVEIVKGQIGREFEVLLKTDQSLAETTKIHNITPEILDKHGVDRKQGLSDFWSFVNDSPLLAHNIQFDWKMISANSKRSKVDILEKPVLFDSLEFCRRLFPNLWSHKLEKMISYLTIPGVNSHNALDDVHATANLIIKIFPMLKSKCSEQRLWYKRNEKRILEFKKNFSSIWRLWSSMLDFEISFPEVIRNFLSYVNNLKIEKSIRNKNADKETRNNGGSCPAKADSNEFGEGNSLFIQRLNKIQSTRVDVALEANVDLKEIQTNVEMKEMDKLFRHMEKRCGTRRLRELLSLDFCLPWYQFCKESDLILGDEKLVVSTVHKAKGREFDNVIIPECVDGIYPHFLSKTDEEKKEDARIFYVAMTRAKKKLFFTSHTYDEKKREYIKDSPYIKTIKLFIKHFNFY